MLDRFDVGNIWGVGSATGARLRALDIHTAAHLRDMLPKQARAVGTVVLERLVAELRGIHIQTRGFGSQTIRIPNHCPTLPNALLPICFRYASKVNSNGRIAAITWCN